MLIKFKNCNVPIHQLRTGTVVLLESSGEDDMYYNIKYIDYVTSDSPTEGVAWLSLYNVFGDEPVISELLTWLEPL